MGRGTQGLDHRSLVGRPGAPATLRRRARVLLATPLLISTAAILAGCGSSGASQASSAPKATCQEIAATLSDGPDPSADPVGYAEAQILPLREIRTSDASLRSAVDKLASAYQAFSATNGSATAKRAVSTASAQVNALCPGAAS
jgi:hypothetical protein